jgi:hypothetical protein
VVEPSIARITADILPTLPLSVAAFPAAIQRVVEQAWDAALASIPGAAVVDSSIPWGKMSGQERAIVTLLAKNRDRIVTSRELLHATGALHYAAPKSFINTKMHLARKKLEGSGWEILSTPGIGYQLVRKGD